MKRRSIGSILVNNLDPGIKERILNLQICNKVLKKFDEEEKMEEVAYITDLRDLKTKTDTEVYNTINRMFKNNQFFMYCGPLLLNVNPGPNHVNDYLNLHKWLAETKNLPEPRWKPHLYSFINYVYQTLISEGKDQVINMLGQIGSGKTFNMIHSIEYLCYTSATENRQSEIFDVMHRSIQLIHIMGSIFRQNNMESTSCGILIRIGFNEENKICNFDFESQILDFTLPFSENGRSFSILHALMTGANNEIKKLLDLPEYDSQLNFFKKFAKSFNNNTKETFRLNDLEIWTRFHSLLNTFNFNKNEILEVLQLFSFILLCNEAGIKKGTTGEKSKTEDFCIVKGHSSKKLAKMLNMKEEDFLKKFGNFKDIKDLKNTLISLMKHAYYMVFEFIKIKIKKYCKNYFENLRGIPTDKSHLNSTPNQNNNVKPNPNHSFNNTFSNNITSTNLNNYIKYINFLDFPGIVEDNTLGGFSTNLANECLNFFAGSQYFSVVEKLEEEKLNLKYFQPLHSLHSVESLVGSNGIFRFLSNPFTEQNYRNFQKKANNKNYYNKTTEFEPENELVFKFKFSHTNIIYNYEDLYTETKSVMINNKIMNLFSSSKNSIIKSVYKTVLDPNKNFHSFTVKTLKEFFQPLEGLSPFVIYCLHSNNSLRLFFGDSYVNQSDDDSNCIPMYQTQLMMRNSLIMPVLHWEWYGYHEWVKIESFVSEFIPDFDKIKGSVLKVKNNKNNAKLVDVNLLHLNQYDQANYILSVLGSDKSYIVGANHVLLKKGSLRTLKKLIGGLLELINKKNNPSQGGPSSNNQPPKRGATLNNNGNNNNPQIKRGTTSMANNRSKSNISNASNLSNQSSKVSVNSAAPGQKKSQVKNERATSVSKRENPSSGSNKDINYNNSNTSFTFQPINNSNDNLNFKKMNSSEYPERKQSMKVQCHLNLINSLNTFNGINQGNSQINTSNTQGISKDITENSKTVTENALINYPTPASHYTLFRILNIDYQNNTLNTSQENTDNNEQYEKYKKDNNIIVPNTQHFNVFKNLLDYSKIDNFDIFDYSDYSDEVRLIQTVYRAFRARKKYKIFRWVNKKIILVQKFARGLITRKKFKKFLYCHNCIVFIQKLYKMRNNKKIENIIKIQCLFRSKLAIKKLMKRIERRQRIENGEESENEEDSQNDIQSYHEQKRSPSPKKSKLVSNDFEQELLNASVKTERKMSSVKNSNRNSNINTNKNTYSNINKDKDMNKSGIAHSGLANMSISDLEQETDKRKIIEHLLLDQTLAKQNDSVLGTTQYERAGMSDKLRKKIDQNNRYKRQIKGNRIEDKLIQYGENLKLKRVEAKLNKLKEEEQFTFKPMTHFSGLDITKLEGPDFMQRLDYYGQKKEQKIEEIRSKNTEKFLSDLTFKPHISNSAKGIKRDVNDLFSWKQKKDENLTRRKQEKDYEEMEMIEKSLRTPKIDKNSEFIVRQKFEKTIIDKINIQNENDNYDLWPINMQKNYFEK